jgi:hypothetical protein
MKLGIDPQKISAASLRVLLIQGFQRQFFFFFSPLKNVLGTAAFFPFWFLVVLRPEGGFFFKISAKVSDVFF